MAAVDPAASGPSGCRRSARGVWRARAALAALCLALVVGAAPRLAAQGRAYQLGPKDEIEVKVFEAPELSGELRVSDTGTVTLPVQGQHFRYIWDGRSQTISCVLKVSPVQ